MNNKSFVDEVKNIRNLREAWTSVFGNSQSSLSRKIRHEAQTYNKEIDKHLKRIQRQLREDGFRFQPALGNPKKKEGSKGKRPIVIPPIDSRVVQRAILQSIQTHPEVKSLIQVPTSCGGIEKRGVKYAVEMAYNKIMADGNYYFRSDIKSFFTQISKSMVVNRVKEFLSEDRFIDLFEQAIDVVLSNTFELGDDIKLFPLSDLGVAQGSCLSPFIGNLILAEFDKTMNTEDVLCLRYIDDFIVIGPTERAVSATLKKGRRILDELGLEIYEPDLDKGKAEKGETSKGFKFLGCDIRPNMITPIKKSRGRLIEKVHNAVNLSKTRMNAKDFPGPIHDRSFIKTLVTIDDTVKAWGNQYQFCNNHQILKQMDEEISSIIKEYIGFYARKIKNIKEDSISERRRLLGIHALVDSKSNPIVNKE